MKDLVVGVGVWVVGGFMMWSFINGGADPDCGYDCEATAKVTEKEKQEFVNESYIETQRQIELSKKLQAINEQTQQINYSLDSRLYQGQ